MKKYSAYQMRTFKCPDCGTVRQATKARGRTGKGHIKDMYCHICKAERKFVQTSSELVRM